MVSRNAAGRNPLTQADSNDRGIAQDAICAFRQSPPQTKIRHSRAEIQTLSLELRQYPIAGTGVIRTRKILTGVFWSESGSFQFESRIVSRTNGFAKKLENHRAAVALWICFYNFCRVHESQRMTPGMALGVTDHIWSVEN
jgi:hypothetical protein